MSKNSNEKFKYYLIGEKLTEHNNLKKISRNAAIQSAKRIATRTAIVATTVATLYALYNTVTNN